MPCGPKELCPAGSKEPLEECKGLHKRNNETEVTHIAYHFVVFNQRMLVLWVMLLS